MKSAVMPLLLSLLLHTATAQYTDLQTQYRGGNLSCDHHEASYGSSPPAHCRVAVVGAGFSGIYFAWRLGIDLGAYDPSEICIFETNSRLGGRAYTVRRSIPGIDIPVDIGAYRVKEKHHLPYDLITKALLIPTRCYDYDCSGGGCDGDVCYKVTDAYSNSQFSLPMEVMLGQLKGRGAHVYFGAEVTDVAHTTPQSKGAVLTVSRHGGEREHTVSADITLLNTPLGVLRGFPESSVVGAKHVDATVLECSFDPLHKLGAKVYAVYDDAWWYNILGKMEGTFGTQNESLPLAGRYQDGPVRCTTGTGRDGAATFSDGPVPFGNCSGALLSFLVYAGDGAELWTDLMFHRKTDPLSVITATSEEGWVLGTLHEELMEVHGAELRAKGVDPAELAPPRSVVFGSFVEDNVFVPACYRMQHCFTDAEKMKAFRRPNPRHDVFLANQDYGMEDQVGWATGGLLMAEKILQAEMHQPAPTWLNATYYQIEVVDKA